MLKTIVILLGILVGGILLSFGMVIGYVLAQALMISICDFIDRKDSK